MLLDHFSRGFNETNQNQMNIALLVQTKQIQTHVDLFRQSENVVIAFPLYTDAMPGIVKHFFEALEPLCKTDAHPRLGFIVQSGFPEPIHSRFVERYLEKLAKRLGCGYSGTIVKGGVEGIQVMPAWMTKTLLNTFYQLGKRYAEIHAFDPVLTQKLAPRDRMTTRRLYIFQIMQRLGMSNFYWNSQLKKNNVFNQRFDQPFL
jgi:hypothetical protein